MATTILQERLRLKLFEYICDNNPDLLFQLEEEQRVTPYLKEKVAGIDIVITAHATEPDYFLEERCLLLLTNDLKPSRYNFIRRVLEEEFSEIFQQLIESGTVKYEAVNLTHHCNDLFEAMHFNDIKEENRLLYYAVAGAISEYFDKAASAGERRETWVTTAGRK